MTVDYVRLTEKGYSEKGGGAGLDLVVDGRKSDELGVNSGLTLGVDFYGNRKGHETGCASRPGGWREIVSGGLGDTTAHFKDGTPFTLHGEGSTSGWFGRRGCSAAPPASRLAANWGPSSGTTTLPSHCAGRCGSGFDCYLERQRTDNS